MTIPERSDFSEGLPRRFPGDSEFSQVRGQAAIKVPGRAREAFAG